MKKRLQFLAFALVLAALSSWLIGCAGCPTCQGAEWRAAASPQSQSDDVPPPPPPRPHARPIVPQDDFATPPTDGPDPADTQPSTPPAPPTQPTTPKGRTRLVKETDGGIVIENSGSGSVILNSPGATPPAPAEAQAPAVAAPQLLASYPLIPGPLSDAQVLGLAKRIGGGLYYAVTGKCPAPKASTVQVPVATSYVQQVHYATVPVQTVQVASAPQYVTVAAAPQFVPAATAPAPTPPLYALPQAAPQPVYATPQTPRKSLFSCLKK